MIIPDRFYTRKQVARILKISTKTVSRWSEKGKLAKPIYLNSRDVRWFGSDIIEFQKRALRGEFSKDKPDDDEKV